MMRAKIKLSLASIVSILLFVGIYGFIIQNATPQDQNRGTVVILIQKVGGVWMVRDNFNNKKPIIYRGQKVMWIAYRTDTYIQFPDSTIFEEEKGFTAHGKDNIPLRLTVRADADTGTYVYSVFCLKDSVYGKGGSPPEFIVH